MLAYSSVFGPPAFPQVAGRGREGSEYASTRVPAPAVAAPADRYAEKYGMWVIAVPVVTRLRALVHQVQPRKGTAMTRIAVIVGSTRPNRKSPAVAEYELVDIADVDLPFLDEPMPPAMGRYENEQTRKSAEKIALCDGYIFVTPSTTTQCREHSRTPSTTSTPNGTTRNNKEQQGPRLRLRAGRDLGRKRWRPCAVRAPSLA